MFLRRDLRRMSSLISPFPFDIEPRVDVRERPIACRTCGMIFQTLRSSFFRIIVVARELLAPDF